MARCTVGPLARAAWTDERLDDLAATLRPLPQQVAALTEAVERLTEETRGIRADFAGLRTEFAGLRTEFAGLRTDLSASQKQIAQIGWGLAVALIGALGAVIAAIVV